MIEMIDLGSTTPPMEDCAQLGSRTYDYADRAKREARAYANLLRRRFGPEPPGVTFSTKSHPHDFGTYYTLTVRYDADDPAAEAYARRCDGGRVDEWDDEARRELGLSPV